MKKILITISSLILLLCLGSCNSTNSSSNLSRTTTNESSNFSSTISSSRSFSSSESEESELKYSYVPDTYRFPELKVNPDAVKAKEDNPNNLVYYEIFVRSFADSNNDGIGDFKGIENNVDYLVRLGIEAVWLMPINKSNSYHGYDVVDYYETEEAYGDIDSFKSMLKVLNDAGIRVMMDLVINHTSDKNPWYLNKTLYKDYYAKMSGKYISSFGGGMIDLNLTNDVVVEELCKIAEYYTNLGVSGFRLDAVLWYFTATEYTTVQPGTEYVYAGQLINKIKARVRAINPDTFIVGEVWANSTVVSNYYFGSDSCFDFDGQSTLIEAANGSNYSAYTNRMYNIYSEIRKKYPDFIDSIFATNHDMDRIANQLNNDSDLDRKLSLVPEMLLTLPGNPYIYYGDEIGMRGYRVEAENIPGYGTAYDELRRLPMRFENNYQTSWISDLGINEGISYQTQKNDENSLFNHYCELIRIRKNNPALAFGNDFQKIQSKFISSGVNGFVRSYNKNGVKQNVLVLHNLNSDSALINLDFNDIIYASNNSDNITLNGYSTIIFELTDAQLEGVLR